jgi:serine/threonine-protein kinase
MSGMPGSTPDLPPLPASLSDRYQLEKPLAMGGSAEVWQGVDRVLKRPVAVKLLHRHLLTDETMRARLTQEAQAAASLSHPGIVAIYDVAVDGDAAVIVMELVEGHTLAEQLRRDRILPPRAAARIGAEVAEALEHAHQRGVIHRDVKAANVLIGPDGEARLVDFGIARLLDDQAMQLTAPGTITGTLRSMAPEQLRGETAGPATDVYATGVLLTELLIGEPPYVVTTPVELAEAQKTPPLVIGDAPPELSAIVRRALDPDISRRQSSAAGLAAELRSWLESDAVPAAAGTSDEMTEAAVVIPAAVASQPDPPEATKPEPEIPAPVPPGPSRSRDARLWAVIGAAVLVALGVFVISQSLGPAGLGAASPSASVVPSLAETPAPTPVPTPIPTPVPAPPTLEAAVQQFRDAVTASQQNGEISEGAAEELVDEANRFVEDEDLRGGDINRIARDLNRAIDEFEREGEIGSPTLATELRRLVDEMEAAARRQSG